MLPEILEQVVSTVDNLQIDKITVVDSGQGGGGVPAVFNQIAGSTPALLESLKASTGIDVAGMLSRASSSGERVANSAANGKRQQRRLYRCVTVT